MDAETLANLRNDAPAIAAFLAENDGQLDTDDAVSGIYWVTMRPRLAPAERYHARLAWDAYPFSPPSIKFADAVRGSLTVTRAWPEITGYRAGSFDICRPICKEGYDTHPEWREGSTAWVSDGNPFLWVVETMQFHLDNEYQGRAA